MGFNADSFQQMDWSERIAEIPVPNLAQWFGADEQPIWKVRNLEGSEVARAKFAKERNLRLKVNLETIAEILSSQDKKKIKEQISNLFGNIEADGDTAWRTELLIMASIDPQVDYPLAARLFKYRPTDYYTITNEIIRLIGLGHEPGKQKPSGEITESKAA
jgi:hypothetical protein